MNLGSEDVARLMPMVFSNWQYHDEMKLNVSALWFTSEWLETVWKYFRNQFENELYRFENLHLLPIGDGLVRKLSKQLPILSSTDVLQRGQKLPPELLNLCKEMSIKSLESLNICSHPAIWDTYVQRPTARGLLTALKRSEDLYGTHTVVSAFTNTSRSCKICFREFIAKWIPLNEITYTDLQLLRVLPIMSTVDGSGNTKSYFVSVADIATAAPRDGRPKPPLPSPQVLLDLSDESSHRIAASLGIRIQSTEEILNQIYFPAVYNYYYTAENIVAFMKYICNNLKYFDLKIMPFAAEVKFISNQEGNLMRPCDLYNKGEVLIAKIFEGEDVFPCGEFAKSCYSDALIKLGLKGTGMITGGEVLKIAKVIELHTDVKRSESLMSLLNQRPELLTSSIDYYSTLKSGLMTLKWVKTVTKRPMQYPTTLNYIGEESQHILATPNITVSSKHAYLIGSVRPTVEIQGIPYLADEFGWNSKPVVEDVVQHLKNTVNCYTSQQKPAVQNILQNVYKHLNTNLAEVPRVLKLLVGQPWIWHGDGFANREQMILVKENIDLKPFAYPPPPEITGFSNLWKHCEIKERVDFVEVLTAIKHYHDNAERSSEEIKRDIQISVNILNHLSTKIDPDKFESIYIPICTKDDKKLVMKKLAECTFCDKEWYQHGFNVEDLRRRRLSHS